MSIGLHEPLDDVANLDNLHVWGLDLKNIFSLVQI